MAHRPIKRVPPDNTGKTYHVRPTARQRQFVALVVEGKSAYSAAIEAGYSKATAKNAYRNIVEKRGCQEYMDDLMEAHLELNTPEMIAENIAEFRKAEKRITIGKRTITTPDWAIRARGVELWLKSIMLGLRMQPESSQATIIDQTPATPKPSSNRAVVAQLLTRNR